MPNPDIASILQRLALAYPEKSLDKATLQVYRQELADVPLALLDQAVTRHIRTSPWFPHISDLRHASQLLAGSVDFTSLPAPGVDFLALEAYQLEKDYYSRGIFEPRVWEKLAMTLERVDRLCKAVEVRQKAWHIQAAVQAQARGEEYPAPQDRRRYAKWERSS